MMPEYVRIIISSSILIHTSLISYKFYTKKRYIILAVYDISHINCLKKCMDSLISIKQSAIFVKK